MASAWKTANMNAPYGVYIPRTQASASGSLGGAEELGGFTSGTFLPPEKKQAFATLNQFLQDPLQNIASRMGPLLRSLIPSEQSARQGYLDVGRRAGGLRSGAFAQGARQLEGDIFGRRAETATRASLGALGPILGGYQTALTGIPALQRNQEIIQNQGGGGGSRGGGAGSDFGGFGFGFSDFGPNNIQPGWNGNYGYNGGRVPTPPPNNQLSVPYAPPPPAPDNTWTGLTGNAGGGAEVYWDPNNRTAWNDWGTGTGVAGGGQYQDPWSASDYSGLAGMGY